MKALKTHGNSTCCFNSQQNSRILAEAVHRPAEIPRQPQEPVQSSHADLHVRRALTWAPTRASACGCSRRPRRSSSSWAAAGCPYFKKFLKISHVNSWQGGKGAQRLLLFVLLLAAWKTGSGQVHYSVLEEAKHGTFVGRIAQDLGLELAELVPRLFRAVSKGHGDLLEVNLQNGILFVNSRIDREELCGLNLECSIHLEVIVDRPLQVFHVEVEVKDINDNPPVFRGKEQRLFIPESRLVDSHFPIEGAADADIGANALLTYTLSPSDYFSLDVQASHELSKSLSLELRKSLDREETPELRLLLTATDGGKPELQGTVQLLITVLDVNDNAPLFAQAVYRVHLLETTANGTLVTTINASDADEGVNGEIVFSFGSDVPLNIQKNFKIDSSSGEIRLIGRLDYEETKSYEIHVKAVDKGSPPMSNHCKVLVKVLDVNDNAPQLAVTSLSLPVREDTPISTVIAFVSVSDRDSGVNGQVTCSLMPHTPFKLVSTFKNYYSLVLDSALDRESVSHYTLVVTARDGGKPELTGTTQLKITILDVNDNAPEFERTVYKVSLFENAPNGTIAVIVNASDLDEGVNKDIVYSFTTDMSSDTLSKFHLDPVSGSIIVKGNIDFEETKLYEIQVEATDKGNPPMAGHCTVLVEILDTNDNVPELVIKSLSLPVLEDAPLGTVIALVSVSDHDSGVNGQVACSLTPQVPFKLVSTFKNYYSLVLDSALDRESVSHYTLVVTGACGPAKPALVCSSAVGSWSCSQQRRQRVCSGEGAPKADLMAFSPSLPPGPIEGNREDHLDLDVDLSAKFGSSDRGTILIDVLIQKGYFFYECGSS
ncbi:protocadherin alpha-1-like [Suricata suricatta]|uniref:protocadherin alpha-1-like n=1 Tax=Suricata suricatta TaxID=37032 RepID=UPI001155406E|nr:protocadherin alpha-1-like [Suricata suricatta]